MILPHSCRTSLSLVALLVLAACAHGPTARPQAAPPPSVQTNEIDAIVMLLEQGDEETARKRIKALLKHDPLNASAHVLSDSVERDPKDLLGPDSFPYTVRPGDTMVGLSERFLGNRLKFYQLSRYNGIDKPATLVAGQALRIPGEPPRLAPPRIESPRAQPSRQATSSSPRPKPAPIAKTPAPVAPTRNPVAARQARAAGLAALNQGNVARAIGLLRRADSLDPGNPAIGRDLQRAQRIAATLKARR